MLSVVVFLPLAAALVLFAVPERRDRAIGRIWIAAAAIDLLLVLAMWVSYAAAGGRGVAFETNLRWIPSVGSGYHIGVDGLSLPLVALTALLFLAAAVYSYRKESRPRTYAVLFLFLQTVSLGLFVSLDLLLFFVFFDLSIVAMYFIIAGWGHAGAARSALQFFLYTFIGSLVLLLGFIGLYLGSTPRTFDIVELARQRPLDGDPVLGGLVLLAISVGLAIKTPVVPFHTWLPPAHTDAPAAGSAILAGILLKMGTFGFVRIAIPILPEAWRDWALAFVIVGVVSAVYGALVALAQTNLKRLIAYTSVNHMGYVILGVGAAGLVSGVADTGAAALAVNGAVTQMVSHGLLSGALFLLAGVLYDRGGSYEMARYGGLAGAAPRFAGLFAVAAFGSLGLPGLSGFIAEFQIFAGSLRMAPVATAIVLLGVAITAALFLRVLQQILLGPRATPDGAPFPELRGRESMAIIPLVALAVALGVAPAFLLDVIQPAAEALVGGLLP